MKKTGLSKVLKLGALGVLVLIVLVFTLFIYVEDRAKWGNQSRKRHGECCSKGDAYG